MSFRLLPRRAVVLALLAVLSLSTLVPARATTGFIYTYAGGGQGADGGSAKGARVSYPSAVEADPWGNIYIADSWNERVAKVYLDPADGVNKIKTVAGVFGSGGFSGDGGSATDAEISWPTGVALDRLGNLFIADIGNHRVRRVDATTGTITTVAGDGFKDGWDNGRYAGDGGPATLASFNRPRKLDFDSRGNLYVADFTNHRVRKVSAGADGLVTGAADETITTVAGNGTKGTSGDGGPATSARIYYAFAVALDRHDNIYVAEEDRIRKVDAATGVITTVAGGGPVPFSDYSYVPVEGLPATKATLGVPHGVDVDDQGNIFIADAGDNVIRRVDALTGILTTIAGTTSEPFLTFPIDGVPARASNFWSPADVSLGPSGHIFIADFQHHRIRVIDP